MVKGGDITPFKSGSHVILIVMSMLRDSKSNDKRKFNDNEGEFNHKASEKHDFS